MRLFASSVLLSLLFAGCVAPSVDLEGTDYDVFFPSLRFSYGGVRSARDDTAKSTGAFELDVSRLSTVWQQHIDSGSVLRLDNVDYVGPTDVSGTLRIDEVKTSLRGEAPFYEIFELRARAGLAVELLRIRTAAAVFGRDRESAYAWGPTFGIELGVQPVSLLRGYGRGDYVLAWGNDYNLGRASFETGIELRPVEHVHLFTAWRYVDLEAERTDAERFGPLFVSTARRGDLDFVVSGLVVGVGIEW